MSEPGNAWPDYARSDLEAAGMLGQNERVWLLACFHYHQAAEKALKAVLVAGGKRLLRIHNLVVLVREAAALVPDLQVLAGWAERLNPFHLHTRYPVESDHTVQLAELEEASRAATAIVSGASVAVHTLLEKRGGRG